MQNRTTAHARMLVGILNLPMPPTVFFFFAWRFFCDVSVASSGNQWRL
ncbi:hypothetical protein JXL21_01070 [Candidatus Bathyarchaeota archaeon]|nr:hypothetical protein [Candidatus Bathyarchaeota archaeon]